MKKRSLLFAALGAVVLSLATGCGETKTNLNNDQLKELVAKFEGMNDSIKSVTSSDYTYQYIDSYGEIETTYNMNKKIYDNSVAISEGTCDYVTYIDELQWKTVEQTFRSLNTAYLIHDETDSGEPTFSYKMTRSAAQLKELLYSGVDTGLITMMSDELTTDTDEAAVTGYKKGDQYVVNFDYEYVEEGAGSMTLDAKIEFKKSGSNYKLTKFNYFQTQKNQFGDPMVIIESKNSYKHKSHGDFEDRSSLLNPNDYSEYYPELEVEPVEQESNVSATVMKNLVAGMYAKTEEATSSQTSVMIGYVTGDNAGLLRIMEENSVLYTGEEYGEAGIVYGTGYENYYFGEVSEDTLALALNYTYQIGFHNTTINDVEGAYNYKIYDFDEATEAQEIYDEISYAEEPAMEGTKASLVDQTVDFFKFYGDQVIGNNFGNVSYAGVKDEQTGTTTIYLNLAFGQSAEDEPGVKSSFVVVFDANGYITTITYTEEYYYNSNLQTETPDIIYAQVVKYNYGETDHEPVTPLDPTQYEVYVEEQA